MTLARVHGFLGILSLFVFLGGFYIVVYRRFEGHGDSFKVQYRGFSSAFFGHDIQNRDL